MKTRTVATKNRIPPLPDTATRRHLRGVTFAVVFFALVCGTAGAQSPGADRAFNQELAADLVRNARELLHAGDRDTARFLLQRAYGIDPESGDAVYLLSTYVDERRRCVLHREWMLRYALSVGFDSIDRDLPAGELARILIDTGRASEAVEFLEAYLGEESPGGAILSAVHAVRRQDDGLPRPADHRSPPPLELLFMEALLQSDPAWFSSRVLERMRYRYPEDFALTRLDLDRREHLSPSLLEWVDASLLASAPGGSDDASLTDILGHLISLLSDRSREALPQELLTHLTLQYYLRGGTDPVHAVGLLLEHRDGVPSLASTSLDETWIRDKRVWETIARHHDPDDHTEPLPEPLDSGMRRLMESDHISIHLDDGARSGYQLYFLERGVLRRWQHDESGNGLYNKVVELDDTALVLTERVGDVIVRVEFSRYPMVTRAWLLRTRTGNSVEGTGCALEEERELIVPEVGRRWTPPRPVPHDPGLRLETDLDEGSLPVRSSMENGHFPLWDVLGGRVTFETGMRMRFQRQFDSDDARGLSPAETEVMTELLRALDVIR